VNADGEDISANLKKLRVSIAQWWLILSNAQILGFESRRSIPWKHWHKKNMPIRNIYYEKSEMKILRAGIAHLRAGIADW
jgi:polyphosphate kinase 2 (PPK2 family)